MSPETDPIEPELLAYLSGFVSQHKLERFEAVLRERTRSLTVVLEDIYLRQNVSACLRSCDCFGIQDVHIIENEHPFRVNRDIARGAAQWLTLRRYRGEVNNTHACLEALKEQGYRIVATTPRPDAQPLDALELQQKTALLFGSEHAGLSKSALDMADGFVQIPMHGFTGSFNLSVAVAVCLYELSSRLRRSDLNWRLSPAECDDLRTAWIRLVLKKRFKQHEEAFLKLSAERARQGAARPE